MNKPRLIDISQEDLDALIQRVEAGTLLDSAREIIKAMAETISLLSRAVDEKTAAIRRLLKMIFGSSTEKTSAVLKAKEQETAVAEKDKSGRPDKDPPKGHGKNGAASYSGADKVEIQHETLKAKDTCPKCLKGKLYEVKTPKTVVRVWDIYTMLTDIEDAFRCMKSELGLRPIYHQKEHRCDGHIFITLLAYHLLHIIRFKLRQKGIRFCWDTIRKQLSTQVRITTTMKREDGKIIHIRKSSKAEPSHQIIYDALNLTYQPGRIIKTVM